MFAAGADAAAGVAFAVAVEAARLRLPSAFGFFAFVPIEVATASGGPTRVLLRVETIATRPALSSRVAVANVQANAEDIVETRDARCARVVVSHSGRTRHRINLFTLPSKTSIEERFVTPSPVRCGSPLATSHAHSNIFASCAQSVISSLYVSFSSNPKRVYALPTALIAPTTTADRR